MSYLALARKWRPRTFSELVGQEHITKAIINSINQERLHHAYLFSGTRGVGKTSVARLLAKALNCDNKQNAEPCLKCENCLAIEQGRFIDLIEIDGASKTRVEDTRELLENVQYNPTNARFKIYLIDEVHMLSQHSFNALLKTLEEPPAHVKFLLATTEPQKLPVTVLSRCLQFNLKHLEPELIAKHLQDVLIKERIDFELEALMLLASAAKGSMRDALSLLDQTIATIDNKLTASEVKTILGYTQQDYALDLLYALHNLDADKLIFTSRSIANQGGHFRYTLETFLDYLHQMTLAQSLSLDNPFIGFKDGIKELAKVISSEDIQLFYQIGIKGLEEMHLAPTLSIGFEMTLLRMLTFRPENKVKTPPLAFNSINASEIASASQEPPVIPSPPSLPSKSDIAIEVSEPLAFIEGDFHDEPVIVNSSKPLLAEKPLVEPEISKDKSVSNESWSNILSKLKLSGLALNAAENAELLSQSDKECVLRVSKGHSSLFTTNVISRLEESLSHYYQKTVKVSIHSDAIVEDSPAQQKQIAANLRLKNAELDLNEDSFFQQLKQEFSAELVKNSVDSVEDEL